MTEAVDRHDSGTTKAVGTFPFSVEVLDAETKKSRNAPATRNSATRSLSIAIGGVTDCAAAHSTAVPGKPR